MAATCKQGKTNNKKDKAPSPCIASHVAEALEATSSPFTLLHKYQSQVKRSNRGKIISRSTPTAPRSRGQHLSAEAIVRLAKLRLLLHTHQDSDDSHSHLLYENLKHINLISSLLEAAENISKQRFDCAEKLLKECLLIISSSSSDDASPTERAVKFFAEALLERVDSERGKIDLERKLFDIEECLLNYQHIILSCEEKLPSPQIAQFTAIQAILDTIGSAKAIHLIDFKIKTGLHWSIMMQGLSSQSHGPPQRLKITALGSSKDRLEETGKRLSSFADSLRLPFLYRSVIAEIKDVFDEKLLECEGDEAVVVYSGLHLWSKLANPKKLTSFLKFVKKLNPCVMVVNEIEADTNTSIFVDRLYAALPFTIAFFDCLDTCLRGEAMCRDILEEVFFSDVIQSIITAEEEEGEGTIHRHAKISFWREMFAEFDIGETELSSCCLDQARLMINGNDKWNPCSVEMDGKCMIVGWKGTPLQSISAWKINHHGIEGDTVQLLEL